MEFRWFSVSGMGICLEVNRETVYKWINNKRLSAHIIDMEKWEEQLSNRQTKPLT